MPDEPLIKLTFRPLPDDVPVPVRVRRLLKYALRVCRLRLVAMEEAAPPVPPPEPTAPDPLITMAQDLARQLGETVLLFRVPPVNPLGGTSRIPYAVAEAQAQPWEKEAPHERYTP